MIRKWIFPVIAGLVAMAVGWHGALVATPFVLMHTAMDRLGAGTPVNQFRFGKPSTADNQPIVRPSPDLSYSSCVFDVSNGPVLVDVEPVPGTYWSVSVFDARTDVARVLSDRDTKGKPVRLLLHRDDFQVELTPGYENVAVKYNKGIVLLRILVSDPARYSAVDALRRKAHCQAD